MENLARYIIRASFSQERMKCLDQEGSVVYTAKVGKSQKIFPALEWLAAMCSHIPNKGEQMVRYYGHYSNVARGKRQKAGSDDAIPCILESQGDEKTFRRKSMICPSVYTAQAGRLPHSSWMMSLKSPSMTITFMGILNTPGTTTSRHNALRIRRINEANLRRTG